MDYIDASKSDSPFQAQLDTSKFESPKDVEIQYAKLYTTLHDSVPDVVQRAFVKIESAASTRFILYALGSILLVAGLIYALLPFIGLVLAAIFVLVLLALLVYWYQYRLPGIIERAKIACKLELEAAYHHAVEEAKKQELQHLESMKKLSKQNPIEQAQSEYLRRSQQYQEFKGAMEKIGGKVAAFGSKLERVKKEKPHYDLSQETAAHKKMTEFYGNRIQRLQVAQQKLSIFREKIDEASTKWEFQLDANEAIRALNATDQDAKINEILTEVAFDTVQQEFDAVFAKLDIDARELNAETNLSFGSDAAIDVSDIRIKE